jgi:hypothetical protein
MNSAQLAQYQRNKLQEARLLLASRGELDARGQLRRPIRTAADARRRLDEIRAEVNTDRRRRLAALEAEVTPRGSGGSVGLRLDPQGRLRPVTWETGEVLVRIRRGDS